MKTALRSFAAALLGLIIGSAVNMGLIMVSGNVIPPPPGADVTTLEGLKASIHLFEPRHFVFPFLAHALGTLVGAAVATAIAVGRRPTVALVVGALFLVGGAINIAMLPGPLWFSALDLIVAYLPMAWLGHRLVAGSARRSELAQIA